MGSRKVSEKLGQELSSVEEAQAALRESIETVRQLTEKSESLLRKHRQQIEQAAAAAERDAYLRENPA